MKVKPKTVMVVAGGEWQVPLIRKARSLGLRVINTNPYDDSPGFVYANDGLLADVLDHNMNLMFAMRYRPQAILTDQSDIAVPTVAYLCEQLGLPGIGIEVAERFTNKLRMRDICHRYGFPSPKYQVCHNVGDAARFMQEINCPCVVKPLNNQSSRGVSKINHLDDLDVAYARALSHSRNGDVLIEEFIGGIELTVDGIKTHRKHYCLATSTKEHYPHNEMVAKQLIFSQVNPEINYARLHSQHDNLIEVMGLSFGVTHAEYKYWQGNFYLIEVAARGGGTKISSDIVPLMSGIDTMEYLIRMALGEKIDVVTPDFSKIVCALSFFDFGNGVVREISGLDQAKRIPGVLSIGLNISIGDILKLPEDDRARHGYLIAYADTVGELERLIIQVTKTIMVIYE